MGGGRGTGLQSLCSKIALIIFLAMSAYLILELVIALSDQGQPTGALVPMTNATPVYPYWYQAPAFLSAFWLSLVVYPVAGAFYVIALLSAFAARAKPDPAPRTVPSLDSAEAAATQEPPPLPAVEAVDDVCILGTDLVIRFVSTPIARLFGLTPREMIGTSLEQFVAPGDLAKLASLLLAAHADRDQAVATSIGARQPDDSVVQVDVTCRPALDMGAGSLGTIVLTIHSLSERGRLDDQLAAIWY